MKMSTASHSCLANPCEEKALVRHLGLLLEPDEEIHRVVRGTIYSLGTTAGPGAALVSTLVLTDRRLILAQALGGKIVGSFEISHSSIVSIGNAQPLGYYPLSRVLRCS